MLLNLFHFRYMREHSLQDRMLSDSVLYRILNFLPARQSKVMSCVDLFQADASHVSQTSRKILSEPFLGIRHFSSASPVFFAGVPPEKIETIRA